MVVHLAIASLNDYMLDLVQFVVASLLPSDWFSSGHNGMICHAGDGLD